MKRLYIVIVALLLIFAVKKVSAQVQPNTFSIGAYLNYHDNSYDNNKANITRIALNPDVQYFYKENRAIIGGFTFSRSTHQSLTYSPIDGSEYIWQVRWFNRGAFVGLRQHHPINDKFHVFTEFGFMYLQEKVRSEFVSGSLSPEYRDGSSREEYSIAGYGNVGIMYFINKRLSLESTFVNVNIQYRRPMNVDYASNEWVFEMYGANQLSFALRYYFQVNGKGN